MRRATQLLKIFRPLVGGRCRATLRLAGVLGLLLAVVVPTRAATAADAEIITQRLREKILHDDAPADSTVKRWLGAQRPDGSWPDVDYADQSHAAWRPFQHVVRLRALGIAHQTAGKSYYHDANVLATYTKALDYWVRNEKTILSGNWWFGRIGEQIQLGEALLALLPALTPEQVRAGSALLEGHVHGCGLSDLCTGQNLVWTSTIAIYKGCLENNPAFLKMGFDAIQGTVVVTTDDEGIQPDASFRQHRAQLYSGGYGLGFVRDVSSWVTISQGTAHAFPPATIDLLSRLMLDGDQWMVRGEVFDYSTQGREITRKGVSNKALQLLIACDRMAALKTKREKEFRAMAAAIRRTGPPSVRGNRHFWRVDYMAHQQKAFSTSVRMWSTRTAGLENFNKENIKGYYLPQGTNLIYQRGDEYRDIFPLWDWSRLPGVTCPDAATPPPLPTPGEYLFGTTAFVGGVSDGTSGLAAFDYRQDEVAARKIWFCFEEGFFCLGAGITSGKDNALHTTVNQCLQAGPVTVQQGGKTQAVAGQEQAFGTARWVHHDGIGYLFPVDASLVVKNAPQTGAWKDVNDQHGYTADPITKPVFSLWLDHGARPQDATYQYAVLPGMTPAQVASYAAQSPLQVLSNTRALQAAHHQHHHLTGLAFYEPGELTLPTGFKVGVDKPCLLLVRRQGTKLTLTVANPLNEALDVTVAVGALLKGTGAEPVAGTKASRVRFVLPGGPNAGASLSQQFTL